ncbi:hypothetical protein DFH06DRAFT_1442120 [Mycena polygramma]|nr:hypothetical protein DFH06DRAFT_1442120 [Mycena polygramma]
MSKDVSAKTKDVSPKTKMPKDVAQRSQLLRYNEDISHLEDAVARLNAMILRQKGARSTLSKYIDGCKSVFAPIRRLPTEILTKIFALCEPEPYHCYRVDGPVSSFPDMVRISQHQLLSLSHVCSSWHTVILGTPSLWATVELNLMTTYPISTATLDRIRRRISLSLERSHKHPLYIHLRITRPEDARVILPLLVQHSARWRILDMHITHSIVQFLSAAKGNLPLLEYLKLGGVQRHPAILNVFQNAPKLTRVKIWGPDTASLGLPFGQLSSIIYLCERGLRAIPDGLADIRHCSNQCKISIRNLDITHVPIPIHDFAPIRSNIVHLHLEIRDRKSAEHSRDVVGAILRSLTLPCLKGLILRPPPGSRPYY